MNTPIDPPRFTPPSRHAEATDSRLALAHHEENQHKKKKEEEREETISPEDIYDQATLGVKALIDFLKNFIRTLPEENESGNTGAMAVSITPQANTPAAPVNANAARAASAYGHASQVSASALKSPPAADGAASQLITTSEMRQVHRVLDKLNTLDTRGIVGIKLEKAERFLDSIENAADTALRG